MTDSTEASLIARLLVDPRPIPTLQLTSEDFGTPTHRKTYRTMLSLVQQKRPIDLVTLRAEGVTGIQDLLDNVAGSHAPVEEYASIIRQDAFRRRYLRRVNDLAAMTEEGQSPQQLVASLHDTLIDLSAGIERPDTLGRVRLDEHRGEPEPPYMGVLSPQGTTIVYGESGDGKGWIAARLVSQLLQQGIRVAVLDFEAQPQEWGYRLNKFGVSLDQILYFNPPTTMDRWATPAVADMLRAEGVQYLVVDSALYLIESDDPYSPNSALGYARARRRLNNLPALLLAHVPANADKIFGSIVWKAECRISWRLSKDFVSRRRVLTCRKANGYGWLEGHEYTVHFDESQGELELV